MGLRLLTADIVVSHAPSAPVSAFGLDPSELVFGVRPAGDAPFITPPQRVFVEAVDGRPLVWTAAADRPWLEVQPASGKIPARVTISVRASALGGDPRDDEGHVVVTVDSGGGPRKPRFAWRCASPGNGIRQSARWTYQQTGRSSKAALGSTGGRCTTSACPALRSAVTRFPEHAPARHSMRA